MITQAQIVNAGYRVLPQGAWIRIDPETIPEWDDIANELGFDAQAKEVILCIAGIKEIDND